MKGRAIAILVLSLLLVAFASCGGQSGQTASTGPQTVPITEGDFYIHSPQTTLLAGVPYHFVVTNSGKYNHDFLIMHPMDTGLMIMDDVIAHALATIPNIAAGETKTLDFTFDHTAPANMLEFSDHFGGQYQAGMHEGIVVNNPAGGSFTPYPNDAVPALANASASTSTNGRCDSPVTIKIGSNDAYDQNSVSLKKGDTLVVVNTTQQSFTLTTQPDAGIPLTIVDPGETQPVPFPNSGTFTVSSKEHPGATFTAQVASTAGVTCGYVPVATVSFGVRYPSGSTQGQYFVTPESLTVKANQSITLSNISDASALTFTSNPDGNFGNPKIDVNESQLLLFNNGGTYTFTCAQIPSLKFTVTVQGGDGN